MILAQLLGRQSRAKIPVPLADDRYNRLPQRRFQLARYRRAEFGRSSEKLARESEQLELAIETMETDQAERLAAATPEAVAILGQEDRIGCRHELSRPSLPVDVLGRPSSQRTLPWREMDANFRFRVDGAPGASGQFKVRAGIVAGTSRVRVGRSPKLVPSARSK